MEPELYDWCIIEYKHISQCVGVKNLWFTNINADDPKCNELADLGSVFFKSVVQMGLKNACLLDMKGDKDLCPKDNFDYMIFGGILGDDPPAGRTKKLVEELDVPLRTLGPKQLSTDGAVYTANLIAQGADISDIGFEQDIKIEIEDGEEVILPFRYPLKDGRPFVSDELIEKIKKDGFF
jgi:ribosome biogenesis SPOUT family RNA methylase Rps3